LGTLPDEDGTQKPKNPEPKSAGSEALLYRLPKKTLWGPKRREGAQKRGIRSPTKNPMS